MRENATKTNTLNWEDDLIDGVIDGGGDDTITGREVADNIQTFGGSDDKDTVFARGGDDYVYTLDNDDLDVIDCGDGMNDQYVKDAGDTQTNCEAPGQALRPEYLHSSLKVFPYLLLL